jgi:hypothetical protein
MSGTPRLRAGWAHVKRYAAAVTAAALMFGGATQLLSALNYTISSGVLRLTNAVIRRGFPDHFPLTDYGPIPWLFHLRGAAIGVMLITVGVLVGVLVNIRNGRLPAPLRLRAENESPRRSEG